MEIPRKRRGTPVVLALAGVSLVGGVAGYFYGLWRERARVAPSALASQAPSSSRLITPDTGSAGKFATTFPAPVDGTIYALDQNLYFADGDVALAGISFATPSPSGTIVFVTAAHLFELSGPRLVAIQWYGKQGDFTAGTRSFGPPQQLRRPRSSLKDVTNDFLLVVPESPVTAQQLREHGISSLPLDTRERVDKGEQVWFPYNDLFDDNKPHRLVAGKVIDPNPLRIAISIDEDILLAGASGTPIISQKTNAVIGTASETASSTAKRVVFLTPIRNIAEAVHRGDRSVERPLLSEVIGTGRMIDLNGLKAEEKARVEEAKKLQEEWERK